MYVHCTMRRALWDPGSAVSLVDDPTAALAFAVRRRRVTPQHAALPKDTRVDGIRKRKVCDAQPVLKQTSTN